MLKPAVLPWHVFASNCVLQSMKKDEQIFKKKKVIVYVQYKRQPPLSISSMCAKGKNPFSLVFQLTNA